MNIKKTAGRARARAVTPLFKKHQLYCAVLMTLAPALVLPASAQSFVHYDGSRSNDRDAAVASWAAADEFNGDWGLAAMNAQQAYAAGLSGRGVKLGAVDFPDLGKALNGPAQLLGRFNAHLAAGVEDTWSNNISEAALVQRKAEERQKLADWRAIPGATLQAAVQEAQREPLVRLGEFVKSSYDASMQLVQALRQLEAKLQPDSGDELMNAYRAAANAVNDDTLASTILSMMKIGENPTVDKLIATLVAGDRAVKLAQGPLDAYEAQGANMRYVANKTDADYVGVLVKTGAGSLTLTGDNSYSGGTLLQGGTLGVGSKTALGSGPLAMSDGTTLRAAADKLTLANAVSLSGTGNIDTQAYNMTLSGAISDGTSTGSLTKRGSGTLTLTGAPSYSGNTTIAEGTLAMASYRQTADQTLRFGAVSDVSYGKLQVKGLASFVPQAKLAVDVARVNTLGKGQTLDTVISAGTLDASSFSVTDNSLLFDFKAVINGNAVSLNIVDGVSISQVVKDDRRSAASAAAATLDNQIRLVSKAPVSDMTTVISAMGRLPDATSVARATSQTLPRNTNTAAIMGSLSSLNRIVSSRFAPTAAGQGGSASGISSGESADFQAWIMPFDARVNQGDREGSAGFSANTWGLVGGIEAPIGDARMGVSYAYGNTSVSGNTALAGTSTGSRSRLESNMVAVYGSVPLGELSLAWQADVGRNGNRLSREMRFGGLNRTASSRYHTWDAHLGTSASFTLPLSEVMSLVPSLQIDYTRLQSPSYTESGAGDLNLSVQGKSSEALLLGTGARLNYVLTPSSQISGHLGVSYDVINGRDELVATYAGAPGQAFTTPGPSHSPWLLKAGVSYGFKLPKMTDIALRYDAEGRSGFINQSASVKARWRF